ncbi:MAG: class I SAM-dependent methyltransferase [Chlorobiaceae bacterium]|nr:class I SAM-dependent methyltransferase [Chlorobiaceae bacterium]
MELVPCPIAGDRDFAHWIDAPDRFDLKGPTWTIVRSNSSGLVMLNPRPDESEAGRHYPDESYDPFMHEGKHRSARDRAYLATSRLLLRIKASMVMSGLGKHDGSLRILDVGCSAGRLLLHLHRHWGVPVENLHGIEPDSGTRAAARAAGLTQMYVGFEEAPPDCRFDRIVFWHALEHIHRISDTLDAARRRLKPDGVLIVALPNIDSRDAAIYGADWVALDAPRHLYHFTPYTLGALLAGHGFTLTDVKPYIPDALYNVWYSEKLRCDRTGMRFGINNVMHAVANTGKALMEGVNPERASGFVCRAITS